ncbi:MAG TPA: phosphatidylinositol-specific phospholipase C domain-containing protein [Chloroflexota bacterium]|nr:phosphatidylinositol-specific phospholipase C domain-containing protein [Chloroflexota bacterium]
MKQPTGARARRPVEGGRLFRRRLASAIFALIAASLSLAAAVTTVGAASPCDDLPSGVGCNHRWMSDNADQIGQRPLSQVVLPGSHDAGTYAFPFPANYPPTIDQLPSFYSMTQTNSMTIYNQLRHGIRELDLRIRPSADGTKFVIHHGDIWTSLDFLDVIDDIDRFVVQPGHEKEVIILRIEAHQSMHNWTGDQLATFNNTYCARLSSRFQSISLKPSDIVTDLDAFVGGPPYSRPATFRSMNEIWSLPNHPRIIFDFPASACDWSSPSYVWPLHFNDGYYANLCSANLITASVQAGLSRRANWTSPGPITVFGIPLPIDRPSQPDQFVPGLYTLGVQGTPQADCLFLAPYDLFARDGQANAVIDAVSVWWKASQNNARRNLNILSGDFVERTSLVERSVGINQRDDPRIAFTASVAGGGLYTPGTIAPGAVSIHATCAPLAFDGPVDSSIDQLSWVEGNAAWNQSGSPGLDLPPYPDGTKGATATLTCVDKTGRIARLVVGPITVDVPAQVVSGGPYTVTEGGTVTLSATATSRYPASDLTFAWDLAGGGAFSTPGNAATFDATGRDGPAGPLPLAVRVCDPLGVCTVASTGVTVLNADPRATFGAPASVDEGGSFTLALANPTDPSPADVAAGFAYAFDCGDGVGYGPFGTAPGRACPTTDNGLRAVKGKIRDKDGGTSEYSGAVAVANVAPAVAIAGPAPGAIYPVGTPVTFTASFTDPSSADTHTALWSFDGINVAGAVATGPRTVSATYAFATPGVYAVKLAVTDDDGGVGTASTVNSLDASVVVYDPNGGFVTGGGWFDSPAGACRLTTACAGAIGKASFGFVARYRPGATVPNGESEFQFKAGNLNFHTLAYDWLVVAGAKVRFKGVGTINGEGNYGFMITAIDGQATGGGGPDTFRITIWDRNSGDAVVYDNQPGARDDAEPTTALSGGSIVVHQV